MMQLKSKIDESGKLVFESCEITSAKIVETQTETITSLEEAKTKLADQIKQLEAQLIQATSSYTALTRVFDESSFQTIVAEIASKRKEGKEALTKISLDFTVDDDAHFVLEKARIAVPFITGDAGEPFERIDEIAAFLKTVKKTRVGEKIEAFFLNPPTTEDLIGAWVSAEQDVHDVDFTVDEHLPQAAIERRKRSADKRQEFAHMMIKRAAHTPQEEAWLDGTEDGDARYHEYQKSTVAELAQTLDFDAPAEEPFSVPDLTDDEGVELRAESLREARAPKGDGLFKTVATGVAAALVSAAITPTFVQEIVPTQESAA